MSDAVSREEILADPAGYLRQEREGRLAPDGSLRPREYRPGRLTVREIEGGPRDIAAFLRAPEPEEVLADPGAHPVHVAYAEINRRVRDLGQQWGKCVNCGLPYELTDGSGDGTTCRPECRDAYLSNPDC